MSASSAEPIPVRDVLVLPDKLGVDGLCRAVRAEDDRAAAALALGFWTWTLTTASFRYRWSAPFEANHVRGYGYLGRWAAALRPDLALLVAAPFSEDVEVRDLHAVREAGVERLVLVVERDDDGLEDRVRARAAAAGFDGDAAPVLRMRLVRALRHLDGEDLGDDLEDGDLEEFEPGCVGFSARYLDRCVGWIGELKAALDALPVRRLARDGEWPTFEPSARFSCSSCDTVLTPPLVRAIQYVDLHNPRALVVPGTYCNAGRARHVKRGTTVVHASDLRGTRFSADSRRGDGFIIPGARDYPNLLCPNGHRIGYASIGTADPDAYSLVPGLVLRLPPS